MKGGKNFSYPNLEKTNPNLPSTSLREGTRLGILGKRPFSGCHFLLGLSFHSSAYLNSLPTDGGTTRPKKMK